MKIKTIFVVIVTLVLIGALVNMKGFKDSLTWAFEEDGSESSLPELSNREIEEVANKNKDIKLEGESLEPEDTLSEGDKDENKNEDEKSEPEKLPQEAIE